MTPLRWIGVIAIGGVLLGCQSPPPPGENTIRIIRPSTTQSATSAAPSAAPVAVAPTTSYPGENLEHWIVAVLDRGARIKLEDNSLWEIATEDRSVTMFWVVPQKITVTRSLWSAHPFKLTNADKRATVNARLLTDESAP